MSSQPDFDVCVVGAGIVGASTALWLQHDGHRVAVLDRGRPGGGASYGNAGILATYGCIPVNSPQVFRRLPALLFSSKTPLRIDWRYALTHLPWHLCFLRNCAPARVDQIRADLGRLLRLTDAGIDPLVELSGAQDCIAGDGCFYVYGTESSFRAAEGEREVRRRNGARVKVLGEDEFRDMEPKVTMPVHRALLFEGVRFVRDPGKLVALYLKRLSAAGGEFRRERVSRVEPGNDGVFVHLEDGSVMRCEKLVIASGAWSNTIAGSGAENLPLDTERGYHILFKRHRRRVRRPVAWIDRGFYATPMDQGLRLAGTVELAGLGRGPNKKRIDYLTRAAHEMFGDIGEPDDAWLGFRPTLPDSLPVIGESPRSHRILFAFGHAHLGLTLSGATGRIIADIVAGRDPPVPLDAYSPSRFLG